MNARWGRHDAARRSAGLLAATVAALVVVPLSAMAAPGSSTPPPAPPDAMLDSATLAAVEDDATVQVTERGLVVVEPPMIGPTLPHAFLEAAHAPGATDPDTIGATLGVSEVFSLESRPGARRTIFLDFDGHTTTGSGWNGLQPFNDDPYTVPMSFTSAPYSLDGNPSFNSQERDAIERIWRIVAEDYAPFDVNVTTKDPGVEALRRSSSADMNYGIRIVISPTNDWLDGTSAGGVAYVGSFNWNTALRSWDGETPAYVFTQSLANGFWKFVGEAAAHEAGHTVGLLHDGGDNGSGPSSYYRGHGVGANGWAPIMGVGYYEPTSQWSRGEYTGAFNNFGSPAQQDDIAIIRSYLGDLGTAGPVTVAPRSTTQGLITQGGGTQEFRVTLAGGPTSITVTPEFAGNLLARMQILRNGSQVALVNPTQASEWQLRHTANLPAGSYVIRVTSIGWGTADTGFTSYGSIGRFTLTLDAPGLMPARRLGVG